MTLDLDFGKDGEKKAYIRGGDEKGLDLPDEFVGFEFDVSAPADQDKHVSLRASQFHFHPAFSSLKGKQTDS